MTVARYPEVLRVTEVRAKFESMLAHRLREVIDKLILGFGLSQGAVALVHAERVSKLVVVVWRADIEVRHAGGVGLVEIQSGNSGSRCRVCTVTVRNVKNVIPHPAEAEFIDHGGADGGGPA